MLERDLKTQCWCKLTLTKRECHKCVIFAYQLQGNDVSESTNLQMLLASTALEKGKLVLHLGCSKHLGTRQGPQWDLSAVLHSVETKSAAFRSSAGLQQLRSPRQHLWGVQPSLCAEDCPYDV